ncbi:MAG: hypothetical protein EPO65_05210 [Dehalococcoidia bacterium]|nr:MAG: hypothetical protein EPO65_05210 [Dehalococcoidia bacterium]
MTATLARLEDPALIAQVDPAGFHLLLRALPSSAAAAWKMGSEWPLPPSLRTPRKVLFAGVGGSAIGGDVVATLAGVASDIPVQVIRQYEPPPVDENTLVIASSFSGNTEETLSAYEATSGAMRLALTTGGELARRAQRDGVPVFTYSWDGPPRTGLGFGVFATLAILSRLGVFHLPEHEVESTIEALETYTKLWSPEAPANEAKRIGRALYDRASLVIAPGALEVTARRWAGEIAENAKQWALAAGLPEFNHNLLEAAGSGTVAGLGVVLLDSEVAHQRNRLRIRETARLLRDAGTPVEVVELPGRTMLEAIMVGCALGSWSSYYLALLRGANPYPIPVMDGLKARLSEG